MSGINIFSSTYPDLMVKEPETFICKACDSTITQFKKDIEGNKCCDWDCVENSNKKLYRRDAIMQYDRDRMFKEYFD